MNYLYQMLWLKEIILKMARHLLVVLTNTWSLQLPWCKMHDFLLNEEPSYIIYDKFHVINSYFRLFIVLIIIVFFIQWFLFNAEHAYSVVKYLLCFHFQNNSTHHFLFTIFYLYTHFNNVVLLCTLEIFVCSMLRLIKGNVVALSKDHGTKNMFHNISLPCPSNSYCHAILKERKKDLLWT